MSRISIGLSTVFLLGLFRTHLSAAEQIPEVSVDISVPDKSSADVQASAQLKKQLIERLEQDGFVVVSSDLKHDVGLNLSFRDPGWVIRATRPTETLTRELTDCGLLRAEDQLEIIQKATELARRAHLRAVAEASNSGTPPAAPPTPSRPPSAAVAVSPPPAEGHGFVEGSVGADLLIRGDHADPVVCAGGRFALGPHLGLQLIGGLSASSGGSVDVVEWQTLAGVGYRDSVGERLSVEAAVAGGFLLHHYATSSDSGNRLDPLTLVILTGGARLSRHLGIALRIAPGLSRTEYTQVVGDQVAWSRSRFRLETGIAVVIH